MPITIPFSEVFEGAGSGVQKFTSDIAGEVVKFSCDLWALYPDWLTQSSLPSNSFARGFMNQMCEPLQPPVPPPDAPPFTGGQCSGVLYDVSVNYYNYNPSNCSRFEETVVHRVAGAIAGIEPRVTNPNAGLTQCDPGNPNLPIQIVVWEIISSTQGAYNTGINTVYNAEAPQFTSNATIVGVTRVDGQPDDCGDAPATYPPTQPTVNDFTRTTNIQINDGLDLELEIQVISNNTTYNYPLHYRVNGINVTVDMGGVHFYGSPNITSPDKLNDVPPPGAPPTQDPLGNPVTNIYNNTYLTDPQPPSDGTIEEIVERIVCTEGVLEFVDVVIEVVAGNYPMLLLILQIINDILKEICGIGETEEPIIALPEYWGAKPAIDRPALCYIWKEWDGMTWGASTYSNTVPYPSQSALDEIPNLTNIERSSGEYLATITFDDGAKIRASGISESGAIALLTFYVSKVDSSYVPDNWENRIRITKNPTLATKSLRLRQVEYYEEGQTGNKAPSIKRRIEIQ